MEYVKQLRERARALLGADYREGYGLGKLRAALLPGSDETFSVALDAERVAAEMANVIDGCAHEIERMAALFPSDGDGRPCLLGDKVWLRGREMRVVAVSHKGKVSLRDWDKAGGDGARWHAAGEVSHREPDAMERLKLSVDGALSELGVGEEGRREAEFGIMAAFALGYEHSVCGEGPK